MTPEKCMSMMLKTMAKIAEADQAAPVHDCVLSVSDRAPRPPRRRRRRRAAAPHHAARAAPRRRRALRRSLALRPSPSAHAAPLHLGRSPLARARRLAPRRPFPPHWPQVPAYFTQAERHAMLDAAKIVGYAPHCTCRTSPNP